MSGFFKYFRKDWMIFIAATIAAAIILHLTDQAMNKVEGTNEH
jgi:hypothetical protein